LNFRRYEMEICKKTNVIWPFAGSVRRRLFASVLSHVHTDQGFVEARC
jgi:hypothetical protein